MTESPSGIIKSKPSDPATGDPGDPPPDQNQSENTPVQGSSDDSHSGSDSQSPSNDQDISPQESSNQKETDSQPSSNGPSSIPQSPIKSQASSSLVLGYQSSDPPVQSNPQSDPEGETVAGGSNQGSNNQNENYQYPSDPSTSVDSGPTPTII